MAIKGSSEKRCGYGESGTQKIFYPLPRMLSQYGWNHLHTQIMFQLMERFFVFSGIHSADIQEFPPNGG
jgi:hypothetical protein